MNKDLMITQQDLIDWIDRPPSNDDLDLATFISTRLEKFYDLEHQLQQKENIIKEAREKLNTQLAFTSSYQLNYQSAMSIIEEAKSILDKEVN